MHSHADEIVQVANSLVGVKYRHQGRSLTGIDCVGVPIYIAHKLGLSKWDTRDYGPRPALHEFNRLILKTGATRIPLKDLSHGDMVQVSWERTPPVHIGIYEIDQMGNGWLIHAFLVHRKVSRDPVTPKVWNSFVSAWRLPE